MPEDSLLDLPLPGEPRHERPPTEPSPPTKPAKSRRWLLVVLLVIAAIAGYLAPRPRPALFRTEVELVELPPTRVGDSTTDWPVEIRNGGTRRLEIDSVALEGAHAEELTIDVDNCSQATLAGDEPCVLSLTFSPRAAGDREAVLVVTGSAINSPLRLFVEGTATEPILAASPQVLHFESILLGETTDTNSLRIENGGSATLHFVAPTLVGPAAKDFALIQDGCSGLAIEPDAGCQLAVVFSPSSAGPRRAALRIDSDASGAPHELTLLGSGVAPQPVLVLSETALDFATARVGTAQQMELLLRNGGTGGLRITDIQLEDPAASFDLELHNCDGALLQSEESCRLQVRFTPAAEGKLDAAIQIVSETPEPMATVALTGNAIEPRLRVSPSRVDFGRLPVHSGVRVQQVVMANDGSAALELGSLRLSTQAEDAFLMIVDGCSQAILSPGEECRLEVSFQALEEGPQTATIEIPSGDPDISATLELEGVGARGRLEISTAQVSFGEVEVGDRSRQRVILTNTGSAQLSLSDLRLEGSRDLRIVVDGCRSQPRLQPGGSCTLVLEMAPSDVGRKVASLVTRHNGRTSPSVVPAVGDGILPRLPRIVLDPETQHFASHPLGERSEIATIVVRNEGEGRLAMGEIRLAGDHPQDFQIVPGTCAGAPYLAPSSDCTVGLRFKPTEAGPRSASLSIEHGAAAEPHPLPLGGIGLDESL